MGKSLDKGIIVADLDEVWSRLIDLGEEIDESKWSDPTSCPRWSIKDNFTHIIGTELTLLGMSTPNSDQIDRSIVKNPIGEMNQQWIESMRNWSKREVIDKLAWTTDQRRAAIEKMDGEEFMKLGPSPVGQAPYAKFMQIRIFDCYMHEQDIRQAASLDFYDQGGAAEVSLYFIVDDRRNKVIFSDRTSGFFVKSFVTCLIRSSLQHWWPLSIYR